MHKRCIIRRQSASFLYGAFACCAPRSRWQALHYSVVQDLKDVVAVHRVLNVIRARKKISRSVRVRCDRRFAASKRGQFELSKRFVRESRYGMREAIG